MSRCQRSSVAGVTRNLPQRSRLSNLARMARTARSVSEHRGWGHLTTQHGQMVTQHGDLDLLWS